MCYSKMAPPTFIVLLLAVTFGLLATLLMIVAVATDYWEVIEYKKPLLEKVEGLRLESSIMDDNNGFYKVVKETTIEENTTMVTIYLRSSYGGIWRSCDKISDAYRTSETYKTGMESSKYLQYNCFKYIADYKERLNENLLNDKGVWLVRMMNSAASCNIVCLLCLLSAVITGTYTIVQKQVSACMVTGTMYMLAAVFCCFALVIMHTKINYMREDCYELDPIDLDDFMCHAREVSVGWSIPVAWVSFSFLIIAFALWLLLTRCLRLEKDYTAS